MKHVANAIEKAVPAAINAIDLTSIGWPGVAALGVLGAVYVTKCAIDQKVKLKVEVDSENNSFTVEVN